MRGAPFPCGARRVGVLQPALAADAVRQLVTTGTAKPHTDRFSFIPNMHPSTSVKV